jgi:hypothetical protein
VQNLYRWKEDVERFPAICCMTHFEFQKTSKTALENRVKKGYARENRGNVDSWLGRRAREARHHHAPRAIMARPACTPPINKTSPPSLQHTIFVRALGTLSVRIGRNRGFRGFRKGFLGSFRERDSSLGNLSLSKLFLSLNSFSLLFLSLLFSFISGSD